MRAAFKARYADLDALGVVEGLGVGLDQPLAVGSNARWALF